MIKYSTILLLLLLIPVMEITAQNSCTQTLREAQLTFEKGRIDLVYEKLASCLHSGFDEEEEIAAYKLLVNTYLYYNESQKAKEAMKSFLTLNPEYEIDLIEDSSEFINLYKSFRTTPILLYGLKAGGNINKINVANNYSLDNSSIERGEYSTQIGFQSSLAFEIPILRKLSLAPELYFSLKKHQYSDQLFNFANLTFEETQTFIELPVLLRYDITSLGKNKSITPFVNAGASLNYLVSSEADVLRTDRVSGENQREVSGPSIDLGDLRNSLNYSAVLGAGVKLKNFVGPGILSLEFRYNYGLNNMVNEENRITNTQLIYDYLYIDNDFSANTYSISIGYLLPKYNPKIITKRVKRK